MECSGDMTGNAQVALQVSRLTEVSASGIRIPAAASIAHLQARTEAVSHPDKALEQT
jgi:hypothetical protein